MKKFLTSMVAGAVVLGSTVTGLGVVSANEGVNELWGNPVFVYGGSLSEGQKLDTKNILEIDTVLNMDEVPVTGQDLVRYIGDGNPNANMYSSAYIEKGEKDSGVIVQVIKPENITGVTTSQYANALITAGAEDVNVKVASAVKVSGHSALTGIYKAYEEQGEELDEDRMVVAQEELSVTTGIADENKDKEGFDEGLLTQALISIKNDLAEIKEKLGDQVTKEDVETIVNDALKENQLEDVVTAEQVGDIVSFSEKYMDTGAIDSESVKNQLGSLTTQVADSLKEKTGELGNKVKETVTSEGFWDGIKEFFVNLFDSIKGMFESDDSGVETNEDVTNEGTDGSFTEVGVEPVGEGK